MQVMMRIYILQSLFSLHPDVTSVMSVWRRDLDKFTRGLTKSVALGTLKAVALYLLYVTLLLTIFLTACLICRIQYPTAFISFNVMDKPKCWLLSRYSYISKLITWCFFPNRIGFWTSYGWCSDQPTLPLEWIILLVSRKRFRLFTSFGSPSSGSNKKSDSSSKDSLCIVFNKWIFAWSSEVCRWTWKLHFRFCKY